jgi:hypothetical protein
MDPWFAIRDDKLLILRKLYPEVVVGGLTNTYSCYNMVIILR